MPAILYIPTDPAQQRNNHFDAKCNAGRFAHAHASGNCQPDALRRGQLKLRGSSQASRRGVGLIVPRRSRHEIERRRCPFHFREMRHRPVSRGIANDLPGNESLCRDKKGRRLRVGALHYPGRVAIAFRLRALSPQLPRRSSANPKHVVAHSIFSMPRESQDLKHRLRRSKLVAHFTGTRIAAQRRCIG